MTDDGRQNTDSQAPSSPNNSSDDEPTTAEISRTEVAAIRESLNGIQLSEEQMRELEQSVAEPSSNAGSGEGDLEEETRTIDNDNLRAKLKKKLAESSSAQADEPMVDALVEEARQASEEREEFSPDEVLDDVGLDELSDDSLYDAVFGEAADEPLPEKSDDPFEEDTPTVEVSVDALDKSAAPKADRTPTPRNLEAIREASQAETLTDDVDTQEFEGPEGLDDNLFDTDADDGLAVDEAPTTEEPLAGDAPAATSGDAGDEPDSDSDSDEKSEEKEEAPEPEDVSSPEQAPEPEPAPAAALSFQPGPDYDPDPYGTEEPTSFRGAESLLLQVGATLGGLALMGVSIARLVDEEMFTVIPSTVAGMLSFVGFLMLVGGIVAWVKG